MRDIGQSKNFILIGAAGFIAPRHMAAIKDTGNKIVAVLDVNDSVGIIDSFFPGAYLFSNTQSLQDFISESKDRKSVEDKIDFITICSPNFLHENHIKMGLENGINVICEKPVTLNPNSLERLIRLERKTGASVFTILQLRLHSKVIEFREKIQEEENSQNKIDVELTYITSRGNWYLSSWKGQEEKSGGIAMNIGIHFFDMLHFLFGNVLDSTVNLYTSKKASGFLEFANARVRWFLSIDFIDLPESIKEEGKRTYRSIKYNDEEFEFSGGFTDLHTKSYQEIIFGRGFSLQENIASITTVHKIRSSRIKQLSEKSHSFLRNKSQNVDAG